jgi:hypothetical protein
MNEPQKRPTSRRFPDVGLVFVVVAALIVVVAAILARC